MLTTVVALLALPAHAQVSTMETVFDRVVARNIPAGAPRASAVIMRSLRAHPTNGNDTHDTLKALRQFHVSRLEWAYITDKAFIDKVKGMGLIFGGAASAPSYLIHGNHEGWEEVCVVNLDGDLIIAPWKRSWKPTLWGCVNNPELERGYVEYLKRCLDGGADVMQRDEPGSNFNAVSWGGCFCEHCMGAFGVWLADNTTAEKRRQLGIDDAKTFSYAEHLRKQNAPVGDAFGGWNGGELKQLFTQFQTEATVAFHLRTRKALDEHANRRVPVSCNNGVRRWTDIQLAFDWAFGELSYRHAAPDFLLNAAREAAEHDRVQVVTMPKKGNYDHPERWQRLTRQTIAMSYACGMFCMVPWDVYLPGDAPRYFGTPEQYADLFGFIRGSAEFLDGYEEAAVAGPGAGDPRYGNAPPVAVAGGELVWVVTRALPGKPSSPVVVHLIDWADAPRPFSVQLEPRRFFDGRPLKLTLLTPSDYSEEAHEAAARTGNYSALVAATPLPGGYVTRADLPALAPWGLLVIEPDDTLPKGVWTPSLIAEADSFYRERLIVRMQSASSNAIVRYTTDGSDPTATSTRYEKPVALAETTTVKARAFVDGGTPSEVASSIFEKREGAPVPRPPNGPGLRAALRLWLRAEVLEGALADGDPVRAWTASAGPDALARPVRLHNGTTGAPPTFVASALGGKPVVRFDGVDDHLSIEGFANEHLAGRGFTVFVVSRSEDGAFGLCGNSLNGGGGMPRLYLTRNAFRYDVLDRPISLHAPQGQPVISAFMHDGEATIAAAVNGKLAEPVSNLPAVGEFGGGNLAMPFWSGNQNRVGDLAEIIVFDRELTDVEREGVEAYLGDKYGIQCRPRWR